LLALVCPRIFGAVVNLGSRAVKMGRGPAANASWIDIDQFAIRHARIFGLLVVAAVAYLWLLSARGPDAIPRSLFVVTVGGSLAAVCLALLRIMNQNQQIQARLMESHTDPLTGLANRRAFDLELTRRISQRQRQGTPLSLMVIDVDHFKQINDTYGHQAGDAIIKQVAQLLGGTSRVMDLVARLGGDEFAISLAGTNLEEASLAVERVRTAVCDRPFMFDGREHRLTVSVGLAEAMWDDDATSLIKCADMALYAAKEAGRNCGYRQGSFEPVPCA
jgi:diguanylate cyclase (GGDEF)-like protein